MAELTFNSSTFSLDEDESVLDCLLRNQQSIPYACKAGTCQACLIKTVDCDATAESSKWIKETLRAQGYTLACQWVPPAESTISARLPALDEFSVKVSIKSLDKLNERTLRLRLQVDEDGSMFHYFPGQYLTLINPEGISRSYSIANNFERDLYIELHISQTRLGIFTQWLFSKAQSGDELHIRGPAGDCFYVNPATAQGEGSSDYPIVLAGVGTGLAPLYGILNEALAQGHKGEVSLFHGGQTSQHLYYLNELSDLQKRFPQFHYYPCVREAADSSASTELNENIIQADLQAALDQKLDLEALAKTKIYLCGGPDFVHGLRKKIFLKGAKSSNIYCDPFVERSINPSTG